MLSNKPLKLRKTLLIITSLSLVNACNQDKPKEQALKFSKSLWEKREDIDYPDIAYPYRERMLGNLVKNHQLKGLTYRQLVDSLGEPGNFTEKDDTVRYEIIVGFESDIDPTYGKNLNLALSPDSVVTSYKISEWKHN